ncbi:MAG: hypothetical protein CVT49_00135 [candidate division Zixibacteria bacterium HGW-Zixibacteria-1]|nr:MAG: hypothetical protein CVT49_00135 [candidate division Zixibacteria bacterium HGW-Zixibacteria-1]
MLITQQHLKDQESYFESLARWHALHAGDNYGLVRKSPSGEAALSLIATVSGSRLRVEIKRCQALTPGGYFIEVNDNLAEIITGETDITETQVPVFVAADADSRKLTGDPDSSEDIPRVPFQMQNYSVHLGKNPPFPEIQYIQVAELTINGSEVMPSPDYFPPCITINADDRLAQKTVDFRNRLENLLKLSTRAYMAVAAAGALEGASTTLQKAFKETVYHMVSYLASNLDNFMVGRNAMHPIMMVIYFKRLFRVVSSLLNLRPGLKDYLNERFFTRELNSEVGRFMSSVDAFLLMEYNHRDLGSQISMIENILNVLRGMMAFLAQTKPEQLGEQAVATETLTYAGKTYRNLAYTACRMEQVGELSYLQIQIAEPCPVNDSVILINKDLYSDAEWRSMQVRLGMNEARGLGETDPIDIDIVTFGNKVALHPRDMLKSSSVRKCTLIFRGTGNPKKLAGLGKMDLIVYKI